MRGEAKNAAAIVPGWQNHQPVWSEVNYHGLARRGYRRNELIYSCVDYRAKSAAATTLRLYDDHESEIANHPARQLLKHPNPLTTEFDFWNMTIGISDIAGRAYWLKERSRNGRVIGLWPLRPDYIVPIVNTTDGIEAYRNDLVDKVYPANDVLAFTNFDPLDLFNGWSPTQAASRLIDVDNSTADYLKVFFQNNAMVRGVLKLKGKTTDSEASRLKAKWRDQYGGVSNWGEIAVLDSDADYVKVGSDFKDMDFGNLDARTEARICMVFGIPPILVGAKIGLDRSTFSNYAEARLAFWQDTMMPIYKHLGDEFALGMRDEFGDAPTATFDMSNVPALMELRATRLKSAQEAWQNGIATRNEARRLAQLAVVKSGDVFIDELGAQTATMPSKLDSNITANKNISNAGLVAEHKKKHAYRRDLIARAYETRFRESAQIVFAEESKRVLRFLDGQKASTDWGEIRRTINQALEASKDDWRNAFAPLIELILGDTIDAISTDFGIAFDINNPFVQVFINTYVPKFADMIVSSTRNALVTDMLQKAQDEGLSIPDLARLIRGKYEQWDATRSTVIARTETIRSSNAGALAAIRDVGIDKKQWLATNDTRTRPDHRHADGQIVGVDEAFVVGGEKLQYPGDPEASAKQTIQCRCTVIPIVDGLEQPVSPQAEPQSYRPGDGAKVSAALANTAKGSTKKEIDLAIKLLDAVHADGDLPEIPIGQNASKSSYGVYTRSLYDVAKDIKISSLGDHKRLTTWHEIGHFIDHKGLPGAGFTTQNAGAELTKAWFDAVQNSKAVQTLAELKYKTELIYKTEDGKEIAMRVNRQYVSYSTSAIELWARSYAQYIATKSKDTEILGWIEDQARSVYPTQWEQDDFAPILAAIDGMFLKLGWIK